MNPVQSASIPGVRCGKCLGRITDEDNEWSRSMQATHRPGTPWQPPRVCGPCVVQTILEWPDEEDDEVEKC